MMALRRGLFNSIPAADQNTLLARYDHGLNNISCRIIMEHCKHVYGTLNLAQTSEYQRQLALPIADIHDWRAYMNLQIRLYAILDQAGQPYPTSLILKNIHDATAHEPIMRKLLDNYHQAKPGPPSKNFLEDLFLYIEQHIPYLLSTASSITAKALGYKASAISTSVGRSPAKKSGKARNMSTDNNPKGKRFTDYPWPSRSMGTYCWCHGYDHHDSSDCLVMQDPDRFHNGAPYTPIMRSAASPNAVPGLKGNTK
jgi:hypothetical protein